MLVDAWLEAGDPLGMIASVQASAVTDASEFLRRRQATEKARRLAIGSLCSLLSDDGYQATTRFERGLVGELRFDVEQQSGRFPRWSSDSKSP